MREAARQACEIVHGAEPRSPFFPAARRGGRSGLFGQGARWKGLSRRGSSSRLPWWHLAGNGAVHILTTTSTSRLPQNAAEAIIVPVQLDQHQAGYIVVMNRDGDVGGFDLQNVKGLDSLARAMGGDLIYRRMGNSTVFDLTLPAAVHQSWVSA